MGKWVLCGQAGPLWVSRSCVDNRSCVGKWVLCGHQVCVGKWVLCGQAGPLWVSGSCVDKQVLCGCVQHNPADDRVLVLLWAECKRCSDNPWHLAWPGCQRMYVLLAQNGCCVLQLMVVAMLQAAGDGFSSQGNVSGRPNFLHGDDIEDDFNWDKLL